jgi:TatD DNase family protein
VLWIDTHCHLDASEFAADFDAVRTRARAEGVACCVIPSVETSGFDACRLLAHRYGDAYALGIHPLAVERAHDDAIDQLDHALTLHANDPHLVAIGEIGLDYFVPQLAAPGPLRERQQHFYRTQLQLARKHGLPVILHVRRALDQVLKGLREIGVPGGIAHAFNGSLQQAQALLSLGFKLGFGGATTYQRATRLRALAATLPDSAIVMETDAPDIPPHWLHQEQGTTRNEPAELPRIAANIAALRNLTPQQWAAQTSANAQDALPRLQWISHLSDKAR